MIDGAFALVGRPRQYWQEPPTGKSEEKRWTTRPRGRLATWTTFAAQRIACALTLDVATEVAHALSLPTACDPRARAAGE